jgi:hypothetical protein
MFTMVRAAELQQPKPRGATAATRKTAIFIADAAQHLKVILAFRGRNVKFAFEWPRGSRGWTQPGPMQQILKHLPYQANFDGCQYGLVDRQQQPICKPWRVQSSWEDLPNKLNKRCAHERRLGVCSGETALNSGFYTYRFAASVSLSSLADLTRSNLASSRSDGSRSSGSVKQPTVTPISSPLVAESSSHGPSAVP